MIQLYSYSNEIFFLTLQVTFIDQKFFLNFISKINSKNNICWFKLFKWKKQRIFSI